jgi:hypothetical protein
MSRLGLGTRTRPELEVAVYQSLNSSFCKKSEELIKKLDAFDPEVKEEAFTAIERMRTGEIDFAAEMQNTVSGVPTEGMEKISLLILLIAEIEWNVEQIKSETK